MLASRGNVVTQHQFLPKRSKPSILCCVVGPSKVMSTDSIGNEPMSWTRHAHGGCIGWPVSTAELVMLVCLGLELPGSGVMPASAVVLSQPLVSVEEVEMGLRRQIGIAAHTGDPIPASLL